MVKKVFLMLPLLMLSIASFGQFFYNDHSTVDSVEISYKWKENKKDIKELRLKFKNKNQHPVMINMDVDYYMSGILKESSTIRNFCMSPMSMVAGKLNGIIVTSSELNKEELQSADFEFRFNNIEVIEVDDCPQDTQEDEENGEAANVK